MTPAPGDPRANDRGSEAEVPRVVVRDKRRIDPDSGQVRPAGSVMDAAADAAGGPPTMPIATPVGGGVGNSGGGGSAAADVAALRQQAVERTADLQRLKAEYDNYRRRVERDRHVSAETAVAKLLAGLLPTLDDIGRARDHGDLEGPFKSVAEALESQLEHAGLERYGSPGEAFDPLVHDALLHSYRSDVSEPTCVEIFRAGYRFGGRVLRPAQVSVAEPPLDEPLDAPVHDLGEAFDPPGSAGPAQQATPPLGPPAAPTTAPPTAPPPAPPSVPPPHAHPDGDSLPEAQDGAGPAAPADPSSSDDGSVRVE